MRGSGSGKPNFRTRWLHRGFLLGVGAVLGVALSLYYFWLYWPMGAGPAGPPVAREGFGRVWSRRPVLLVGLGDSVTAGFGASPGLSYFDRLVANPPDEFPEMRGVCLRAVLPNLRAENKAISGTTSLDHAARQVKKLPRQPPETLGLVVMTTGGNDIIHNYGRSAPEEGAMYGATLPQAQPWIENFARRLEGMLREVRAAFPGGCHIFLANIYDPTDGQGTANAVGLPAWKDGLAIHRAYNEVIDRMAGRVPGVHLVDMHNPLLGHGIYCRQFWRPHYQRQDPHYWYLDNFEDPNDRGYDAIRRLFLREMVEVLGLGGG